MKCKPIITTANFRRSHSGFTLVELLVVILIIIVLAGILYPTVAKMRASADRSKCITKLRGWGVAMGSYAADHDGKVEWSRWAPIGWDSTRTSVYLDYWTSGTVNVDARDSAGAHEAQLDMRCCPSIKYDKKVQNSPVTYATTRPNVAGALEPNVTTITLSRIRVPARYIMMIESVPASTLSLTGGDFSTRVKPLTQAGPLQRHKGTVNALFADYSVQSMNWKQIEKGLSYWTTY